MEYVSFRLDKSIVKQIDDGIKEHNYSTKSDFLRDAIRTKLKLLEEDKAKKKAWNALFAARGIFKGKGKTNTEEEWYKWRKEYGEKLAEELAKKYDLKI